MTEYFMVLLSKVKLREFIDSKGFIRDKNGLLWEKSHENSWHKQIWQLKTAHKGYLTAPGILLKVEISAHCNVRQWHLKIKT